MPLQGSITDMPAADLIQILTLQNKVGRLEVQRHHLHAQIDFAYGKVRAAAIYSSNYAPWQALWQGHEAIYTFLDWQDGEFCFSLKEQMDGFSNVSASADYLLLEYHRRKDEETHQLAQFGNEAHERTNRTTLQVVSQITSTAVNSLQQHWMSTPQVAYAMADSGYNSSVYNSPAPVSPSPAAPAPKVKRGLLSSLVRHLRGL